MPILTVVVPCYNHEKFLGAAIESVLCQTLEDIELIVVNDGSSDGSYEVATSFRDPRVKVLTQDNQGAHHAINRGLASATAPFLTILNSDDVYYPNRLAALVEALESQPAPAMVGTFLEVVNSTGEEALGVKKGAETLPPWQLEKPELSFRRDADMRVVQLTENPWATSSNMAFSREMFQKVGDFRPLRFTHDWDYALRLGELGPLVLLPEVLLQYRVHQNNTLGSDPLTMTFELLWCQGAHLPRQRQLDWFQCESREHRSRQLLYSLQDFGVGSVLSSMMAQGIAFDEEAALALLDHTDESRGDYLQYLDRNLGGGPLHRKLRDWLARLRSWLRTTIR